MHNITTFNHNIEFYISIKITWKHILVSINACPFGTTPYSYFKDSLDNYKISVYKNKEHLGLTNCINYKFKLCILILITGNMQLMYQHTH